MNVLKPFIAKTILKPGSIPISFFLITLLAYGLFIPFLGFYMDDWYIIWFKDTFGAQNFINYFMLDRPLEGYFFYIINLIVFDSVSPVVWQLVTIFTHWLCVISIWGFLDTFWPDNRTQNYLVSLLAVVYPGFTQSNMIQYSFHFFCLACLFFSFTLMIKSFKNPNKYWIYTILAILLGLYGYAGADFYAGLELIRPVIIVLFVLRSNVLLKKSFRKIILYGIPYLIPYLLFSLWRGFVFESQNHKVAIDTSIIQNPMQTIITLLQTIWQGASDAVVNSWAKIFSLSNFPQTGLVSWIIFIIIVFLFLFSIICVIYTERKKNSDDELINLKWRKESIILALFSLIVSVLPFWAANLQIDTVYPYDRFLLAYLFGSCLLVIALLETPRGFRKVNLVLVCLLLSLGVGNQIANSNRFKNQWANQKDLYWQIVWRIPNLEKGTTLWAYQFSENAYYTGAALGAQLNWTYGETDVKNNEIGYDFILINSGQNKFIEELSPNKDISTVNRTYHFEGNTTNTIYLHKDSNKCLRIFDDEITPIKTVVTDYNKDMIDASSLTNLDLINAINANVANPVYRVVGREPSHDWCYFFEKAELARQEQRYDEILSLLKEAQSMNLEPGESTEWYPFIEALGRTSNWIEAEKYSTLVVADTEVPKNGVCHIWYRFGDVYQEDESMASYINKQLSLLGCD